MPSLIFAFLIRSLDVTPNRFLPLQNETKQTTTGCILRRPNSESVAPHKGEAERAERSSVLPLKSPRPLFRVSSGSEPGGWQSQRSLSFVQLCIWALTRGRATRAMLMGTKWGVSPRWITEGEEKHVFSCIHVRSQGPAFLPRSLALLCLLFNSNQSGLSLRLLLNRRCSQLYSQTLTRMMRKDSNQQTFQ